MNGARAVKRLVAHGISPYNFPQDSHEGQTMAKAFSVASWNVVGTIGVRLAAFAVSLSIASWSVGAQLPVGDDRASPTLGVIPIEPNVCETPTTASAKTPEGVCVMAVIPGGAAERAGIKRGDSIRRFADKDVANGLDLMRASSGMRAGDRASVLVRRDGVDVALTVEFTAADAKPTIAPTAGGASSSVKPVDFTPYEIWTLPADPKSLIEQLRGKSDYIALVGDVLTILHRDASDELQISGSIQRPMSRIPGTDVWALQARMSEWNKTFFSYEFFSRQRRGSDSSQPLVFHGADAPPLPKKQSKLHGKIVERTLYSEHLGEERRITVYLPHHAHGADMPALFMADGSTAEGFARIVEPLIDAGRVAPIMIVGVHAAAAPPTSKGFSLQMDRRATEYLRFLGDERFEKHMQFFAEEVLPWAIKEYGVSARRNDHAAFGFSNGGAFVVSLAFAHPELFAHALPFSVAGSPERVPTGVALPRFLFAAGRLEPNFRINTKTMHDNIRAAGGDAAFTDYASGHDTLMWELALATYLPQVFPGLAAR